uniref:Uncharacterized protein n=1 Tax=Candidatus Kentrum sp. SD TaxID=2126332 RepID=A0A450Z869_9GAMM|nr:MAG: hypothetical protein BECKSD772E_GA0070983_13092 [Candidatus Kentron sp. SD]
MKHFGSGYAGLGPHHGDARDARVTGKQRKSFSRFHAPARGRVGASIFSIPLAALLGLAAPAHALEHTTGFEVDIRGWTVIKGTSRFNWARQTRGTHSVRIPTNVTADSAHRDRFPALSATGV